MISSSRSFLCLIRNRGISVLSDRSEWLRDNVSRLLNLNRQYRYRSPVLRTLSSLSFTQCAVLRNCFVRSPLYSIYSSLPFYTLNSPPSTLNSTLYTLDPSLSTLLSPLSYGQVRSTQKRRLTFSILPIGRFVSCSLPVMPELMII